MRCPVHNPVRNASRVTLPPRHRQLLVAVGGGAGAAGDHEHRAQLHLRSAHPCARVFNHVSIHVRTNASSRPSFLGMTYPVHLYHGIFSV